jgi:putative salt-induced outer membrane protein YdiY
MRLLNAKGTGRLARTAALALLAAAQGLWVEPVMAQTPAATAEAQTNFVVVTNVLVVTNYVVTTNLPPIIAVIPTNKVSTALPELTWAPPEDNFDWIQLKSGEWLKGKIKAMQDGELEFDSEELELQTFDWKDIRQLRSPHFNEMLFEKQGTASGPVTITPDQVIVSGPAPRTFTRADLLSITPGGKRERDLWSGKIAMGLTLSAGNTESMDYNTQMNFQRRTPATRLSFDYLGNISSENQIQNANNHRVNAEFDVWMSRHLYIIVPQAEYFRDPFQNIADRVSVGAGVGYDLVDRPSLEWNISTGPAYQKTWYESVPAGSPSKRDAVAVTFGSKFDWDLTRRIELILEYRGQYTSREVGETLHHSVSTLAIDLTKRFELDLSFIWDRTQNPRADSTGKVPKQDDFRLVAALGVRF